MQSNAVLTPNQQQVWDLLRAAEAPLGAYALLDRLRGSNFKAPLQVYRALERLVDLGMVHRLESLNAFVACDHDHAEVGPTAFAICDGCGRVEEFTDPGVGRGLAGWSSGKGFQVAKITIELRGRCAACRQDA